MSNNNQINQYAAKSILRGIQDEITASLLNGRMIGDIAVEHNYTIDKCQAIYEGHYDPKHIKPNYINPVEPREDKDEEEAGLFSAVAGFFGKGGYGEEFVVKTIVTVGATAVGGPLAGAAALAVQNELSNDAQKRLLEDEIVRASNSIDKKDEMIRTLYREVVALRAELNK